MRLTTLPDKPTVEEPKQRKTVFDRDEVAHLWAHGRYKYGRAKSTELSFQGDKIFSYRACIGRVFRDETNKIAVALLSSRSWSVTTSRHQHDAERAVSHLTTFRVENPGEDPRSPAQVKEFRYKIEELAKKVVKARDTKAWRIRELEEAVADANAHAIFFRLRARFSIPKWFDLAGELAKAQVWQDGSAERDAKREAAREARREAMTEQQRIYRAEREAALEAQREEARKAYPQLVEEYPSKLQAWLDNESNFFPPVPQNPDTQEYAFPNDGFDRLRVRGRGEKPVIQSSRSVNVAVGASCRSLLSVVQGPPDQQWESINLDGYRVSEVSHETQTVRVGCHKIHFSEIERIARQLGLWDTTEGQPGAEQTQEEVELTV